MTRFEVTGTANDVFTLANIQKALKAAGASRVRSRNAFGWANQPQVATFAAESEAAAKKITDVARGLLGSGTLPALLAFEY